MTNWTPATLSARLILANNFFPRNAVDFGLPLLNNPRTAQLFVDSLAKKMPQGGLRKYAEGRIPSEVKSWREFIGVRG
jgi:carbamoyl-phosphate synthase large subunit